VNTVETAAPPAVVVTGAAPVQGAVDAVTAPATPTAPRSSAPVSRGTSGAAARKTVVPGVSGKVGRAPQTLRSTGASLRQAASAAALKAPVRGVTRATPVAASSRPVQPAASGPASQCDRFPVLASLPAVIDLRALLAIACNAGDILFPSRIGTPRVAGAGVTIGDLVNAATALGAQAYGQVAVLSRYASGVPGLLLATADARHRSASTAGAGRRVSISASGPATGGAVLPRGGAASSPLAKAEAVTRHSRDGFFSTPDSGTGLLSIVLLLDAALLAAIVSWRAARRWVVPRFA
jgi:hypothetical protein